MADFDYAGALFSGKPQGAPADQQVDYASQLFSGVKPNIGTAPGLEKPPVAISEPSMGASAGTAFMGGIPTDKQAAINYFAKQRGISPNRYTIIDGDIAYQADDGKFYKEVSGLGATAAYYAPDVLEMAPDIATGITLSPLSLLGAPGVAAAAGGTGRAKPFPDRAGAERRGRARGGRWLHPAHDHAAAGHQRRAQPQGGLSPGARLHADFDDRVGARGAGRASDGCGEEREGPHRAGPDQPWQIQLRFLGYWQHQSHGRRALCAHGGRQYRAHRLQGFRPRTDRFARRSGAYAIFGSAATAGVHQVWQAARAGDRGHQTRQRVARHADHRGIRSAGI